MSLFSKDKDHAQWRGDNNARGKLEAAAFELLAQLCVGSMKGQKAVAAADECKDCFERAMEVLSELVSAPRPSFEVSRSSPTPSIDALDEKTRETEPDTSEPPDNTAGNATNVNSCEPRDANCLNGVPTLNEVQDTALVAAAYSFLSALVPVARIRNELLERESFFLVSSSLALETRFPEIQFEAVRVIAKLAPYAISKDMHLSERIGDLLMSVLSQDPEYRESPSGRLTKNGLHIHASIGMQFVFDSVPGHKQVSIMNEIASRYFKLLRNHTVAKAVNKGDDRTNGGELAYQLTTLMLLGKGKDSVQDSFGTQLITNLVNTVQWRYDPKTAIDESEMLFWDASVTQCLQLLSLLLLRDIESLAKSGVKLLDLKNSILMVARPGKAPRKAIDFPSALTLASKSGDSAAKVSAQRILNTLNSEI